MEQRGVLAQQLAKDKWVPCFSPDLLYEVIEGQGKAELAVENK